MADTDQNEKTEQPTDKQRRKFREEGQVAKSQDLAAVTTLAAAVAALTAAWPTISSSLTGCARGLLGRLDAHGNEGLIVMFAGKSIVGAVLPVGVTVLIIGVAGQFAQVGFKFSLKPMIPDITKFNPIPKLQQLLFSTSALIELAKSILKVVVIGFIAVRVLIQELSDHTRLAGLTAVELMIRLGDLALTIVLRVGVALAVIAILDLLIERYRHYQKMKMTKQQVKEEHKDQDGDPMMRGRMRAKQKEASRLRMLEDAATADVVVVNPSHYSVALRYNLAEDAAPKIVAMGMNKLAFKIRDRARHEGVPIVSNPPLARGLFYKGKLGGFIPAEYYQTVASLLAWVYSITGRVA